MRSDCKHKCKCGERSAYQCKLYFDIYKWADCDRVQKMKRENSTMETGTKKAIKIKKLRNITIIGRRWFDKRYGNTYHSVKVWANGESLGDSGMHYGYGEGYVQTAVAMLAKAGYFAGEDTYSDFMQWQMANRSKCIIEVSEVGRQKDL